MIWRSVAIACDTSFSQAWSAARKVAPVRCSHSGMIPEPARFSSAARLRNRFLSLSLHPIHHSSKPNRFAHT